MYILRNTPYHCKSHTCERLDTDILSALTEIENKINIRSKILAQEPNSKSIVQVALIVVLKLVSKESDGKTVSLTEQFDCILDEDGVHKSLSLYKEKRFTKLGYLAGAVYAIFSKSTNGNTTQQLIDSILQTIC